MKSPVGVSDFRTRAAYAVIPGQLSVPLAPLFKILFLFLLIESKFLYNHEQRTPLFST